MATLLSVQALSKSFSARPLFKSISFGIDDGDRIAMIGPNGSGKSTLLKILGGLEKPDSGSVSRRTGVRVGYVPQDEEFEPGLTITQAMTRALADEGLDHIEEERRLDVAFTRAGFDDGDQEARTLSGGWRKRLSIAQVMITEPDVILLDEPTNHLDLEGVLWLESLLRGAQFAFLLISHDRVFLENVARRVIELNSIYDGGYLKSDGAYSDFLETRETYIAGQAHQQVALASVVRREIEWLHRGAKARTTKAKGRIEAAGKLIGDLGELKYRNQQVGNAVAGMDFSTSGRQTKELLVLKDVAKSMGGRPLFQHVNAIISPKRRIGLVGPNGSGKTTLLRLFSGSLEPDSGTIRRADKVQTIWFDQDRKLPDPSLTLKDALSPNSDTVTYRDGNMHVSGWAKRFLFRSDQLSMAIASLSGGEKARVLIAQLMLQPADLLILDEPTNDLDIPTLEVLEESLLTFPGAIVLVTHDRYLLERVSTEIMGLMGDGTIGHFADYDQYETARKAVAKASRKVPVAAAVAPPPKAAVAGPALSSSEKRELAQMEAKIEAVEGIVARLEAEMIDPTVATDAPRLKKVWDDLEEARLNVTLQYGRWQELEEKLAASRI